MTDHLGVAVRFERLMRRAVAVATSVAVVAGAAGASARAQAADPASAAATTPAAAAATAAPAATTPDLTATTPVDDPAASTVTADDDELVPRAATQAVSYAARLVVPVVVRARPGTRGKRIARLAPFGSWNGGQVVLQIAEARMVHGQRWLRVRLPVRPNGSTGWLRQSTVEVRKLRYRIEISRRAHKLTLLRDGQAIGSTKVVIGAPGTPTPKGVFAVLEVVKQPKGESIGPWALHLTAHSDVLDNYGGGPGRVALHGRAGPLLHDPLGSSRSHGCVRMPNAFVTRLASVAVEGTPVVIS